MKTSELTGAALDWAVALIEFPDPDYEDADRMVYVEGVDEFHFTPSTDWAQGGPIIEREGINVAYDVEMSQPEGSEYWATVYAVDSGDGRIYGPTPLIAAMRCYVAFKLGDDIALPMELTK